MDVRGPLIVIGAGRSGTGLLSRILDHHPDVSFYGETGFLVARLWHELWEVRPLGLTGKRFAAGSLRSAKDTFPSFEDTARAAEEARLGALIGSIVRQAFNVPPDLKLWGYKEIWNGSPSFQHPWRLYDLAFREAIWLQIVRNPFDFARSCADWNEEDLTERYLLERLNDWVAMVRYSRERRSTGRYSEIRYEDLLARPRETLTPVLEAADLAWHDECLRPLGRRTFFSPRTSSLTLGDHGPIDSVQGLVPLMAELGYEVPGGFVAT
jgi:hypothetical protein